MKHLINSLIIINLVWLTACGGGPDSDPDSDQPANVSPTALAPDDFSAEENTEVTLDASGSSDSDGSITSFAWSQTAGTPTVTINNASASIATFTSPDIATNTQLTFEVTVTDNDGATNSDSIILTITPTVQNNQPPTANAGTDQTVSATGTSEPSMGTNLDGVVDWTTAHPFVDLMKYSRDWITTCIEGVQPDCTSQDAWDSGEQALLDLDEDGWIISLPAPEDAPVYWLARIFWEIDTNYASGRHILTYDGEGSLEYSLGMSLVSETPGRVVVDIDSSVQAMVILLTETDPNGTGNYIRNIKLVREINENIDTDANPFNPDFIDSISDYQLLRFMDWTQTNDSPQSNWDERPQANDHTYTTGLGVPFEVQLKLANQLAIPAWINIPHQADDNYITQFANQALQELDPNLTIYVEYTNEAWNSIFQQSAYMLTQGRATWPNSVESDFTLAVNWFGQRTANVCDIWKTVWGTQNNRVHCVMAGMAGNSWIVEQSMNCPVSSIAPCSAHGIDSIAIAPYFGGELGWIDREAEVQAWDLTTLFSEINNVSIPESLVWVDEHIALANQFNVALTAYEGGQHLVGVNEVVNNDTITALFTSANRDARMQQSYETFLNGWKARGGGVFANFIQMSRYSKWGSWGILEYLGQANTGKAQAVFDYLDANPVGSTSVILNGSGNDPDGTITSYLWEQTAGQSVTLINTDASQASFDVPSISSTSVLTFTLTVTDDDSTTAFDEVMITLEP